MWLKPYLNFSLSFRTQTKLQTQQQANFFFLEKPFARSLLCARVKSTVHVNDLSIALHCLLDLITNINGSKISPDLDLAFFLHFRRPAQQKKNSNILCWITKQLRENIRKMKFWNFSRDSWLFTGMNVVSHFLLLAGIKVVKISFFFPARPDRVELLIDLDSAPRKSAADSQNTQWKRENYKF